MFQDSTIAIVGAGSRVFSEGTIGDIQTTPWWNCPQWPMAGVSTRGR
jgi:alpha-galactosidase/6-phospho-beta-glucosidase family protein